MKTFKKYNLKLTNLRKRALFVFKIRKVVANISMLNYPRLGPVILTVLLSNVQLEWSISIANLCSKFIFLIQFDWDLT